MLLALVGLVLAPMARPVMAMSADVAAMADAAAASDGASAAMGDMPCCPEEPSSAPDCTKHCPFMAMCMGKTFCGTPGSTVVAPVVFVTEIVSSEEFRLHGIAQAPPKRPPKA